MKKINITPMLIVMMFMVGCAFEFMVGCAFDQVQVDQKSQETIAKITARRVGCELEIKYPDVAKEVSAICQEVVNQDEPDFIKIAISRLSVILTAEINDPLLVADIQDILTLLKIEIGIELADSQMQTIKAVAIGLINGIKIGGNKL